MKKRFSVLVEKDEDGYYVATVPTLPGCHTQARSMDQLLDRIKEAIEAYLESERSPNSWVFRLSKLKLAEPEKVVRALANIGFKPVRQHGQPSCHETS